MIKELWYYFDAKAISEPDGKWELYAEACYRLERGEEFKIFTNNGRQFLEFESNKVLYEVTEVYTKTISFQGLVRDDYSF